MNARILPMDAIDAIRKLVASVITSGEEYEERTARLVRVKETEGFRIVDGGQTRGDQWEITDWHTSEVLAAGEGLDAHDALFDSQDWWHIDALADEAYKRLSALPEPDPELLPAGLSDALEFWATEDPVEAEIWLQNTAAAEDDDD